MKKLLLSVMLAVSVSGFAQQDLFALTGKNVDGISFKDFREIDTGHSISGKILMSADSPASVSYKGRIITDNGAQSTTMAALAYDEFSNSLVYIPMFSNAVYFMDINTGKIEMISSEKIKSSACDIATHITRMTSGYDGNIYATNNFGSQVLKIGRDKGTYTVEDLGGLKDAAGNGENSIKKVQIGYGGDMIADAQNNLYILSASGNVFKISLQNLEAKYVGKIKGLPENYALNGSAVNSEGQVVVASMKGGNFYEVDFTNLQAKALPERLSEHVYDLAGKYFLNDRKPNTTGSNISLYPTRVDQGNLYFKDGKASVKENLRLNIFNLTGNNTFTKKIESDYQIFDISRLATGVYVVSVTDSNGKILYSGKILKE